jgi:hypothetical protein
VVGKEDGKKGNSPMRKKMKANDKKITPATTLTVLLPVPPSINVRIATTRLTNANPNAATLDNIVSSFEITSLVNVFDWYFQLTG